MVCESERDFSMSEELKCPFCGGITNVAYYHTGNNLLYCKDCKRTFSERDAKIMKQAARIAELEAERDRLLEALKRVIKLLDLPMLKDDMCLYMNKAIRVAREAMKGAENVEKDS